MTRISPLRAWLSVLASGLLLAALVVGLARSHGSIPALGPLLNPFTGVWRRPPAPFVAPRSSPVRVQGLKGEVEIHVDTDQVKRVFASSDDDLYFAQGYLLASERLAQMDFLTRLAAGRLAELMGPGALDVDKMFAQMGLPEAAKESALAMAQDPVTGPAVRAYVAGVNAYIAALPKEALPFEYKLLGATPERWTVDRIGALLKYMAYNLAGGSNDLLLSRSRSRLSAPEFEELFPLKLAFQEPIAPRGTRWAFPQRAGEPPKEEFLMNMRPGADPTIDNQAPLDPAKGSNNWAVSGRKSTTGKPILSNDIHLNLSLPSLWYEIQLVSPTQNVYGIALPGAPGVILGFNTKLAWGTTNGETDVLDWYEMRFRDEKKSEYLFDGEWRPVIAREAKINVKGQPSVTLMLKRTHLGPIVYAEGEKPLSPRVPRGLVMRWVALEGSNELKSFLLLNKAGTVKECRAALEFYHTPDQNFLCADASGDIGIWHMGRFPVRWKGQGRTISDGTSSAWEWKGWIPSEEVPFAKNPDRGYLSSANQNPVDDTYPHYLGWNFDGPFRAMRINELLKAKPKLAPEDLAAMQGDTLSIPARMILPKLLALIDKSSLNPGAQQAVAALKAWDFRFEEKSTAASIYFVWYKRLTTRMWGAKLPDPNEYSWPPLAKSVEIIAQDPSSKWFDDPATPDRETLKEQAQVALGEALQELARETGSSDLAKWEWAKYRPTELPSLMHIPGLGRDKYPARGTGSSVFANNGLQAPVWKMVVAVGPRPKAWGVYPGGQSGDPASPYYDNFLESWRKNELKELIFPLNRKEPNPRRSHVTRLVGAKEGS